MRIWKGMLLLAVLAVVLPHSANARTWYIKADGTGDAPTIQAGADSAQHGDTVLVAPGTYSHTSQGGNEYGMISILRGSADMTIVSESGASSTILDGEFQNRIFFFQGETELTVDGFTFRRGTSNPVGTFGGGGFAAHYSSPIVKNCVFANNTGQNGAAYWYGGTGSPEVIDCVFKYNNATTGAAIYFINSLGNGVVSGCKFENNSATLRGGAIATYNFRLSIDNCLFSHNSAETEGGALAFSNTHPTSIVSCTFFSNSSGNGANVMAFGTSPITVDQSILAGGEGGGSAYVDESSTLTFGCTDIYGNVGGDWIGGFSAQLGTNGNISVDPMFCSPASSNFMLHEGSPCTPGNHPDGEGCGIIGLQGAGCAVVEVDHQTWGGIKAIFSN